MHSSSMFVSWLTCMVVWAPRYAHTTLPEGVYILTNMNSGKVLNVANNALNNGATVWQWDDPENLSSQWRLAKVGNSTYTLANVNSGKSLNVENNRVDNGAKVWQWDAAESPSSQWRFTSAGNSAFILTNINSGKVLNVENNGMDNGAAVQQWDNPTNRASQWKFASLSPAPSPAPPSPSPPSPPQPTPPVPPVAAPRSIVVSGGKFVDQADLKVLLEGSNVVVKGTPWLPEVSGSSRCGGSGCRSFNAADAAHFNSMGWNFVRLGVIWAGAQPTAEPKLDEQFVSKLLAILDLCHGHGIHVLLDLHQDAVGSGACGEGMPQWFYKKTQPLGIVGTPLVPQISWPYDGTCGPNDFGRWMQYAGEEDYNIKNPCCKKYNQDGWARLLPTVQAQAAMGYLFSKQGRAYYANFTGLLAHAVRDHPAAFGIELMNEPPAIERTSMYDTWMACYEAIRAQVPDMAVGLADTGEIPISTGTVGLSSEAAAWIKNSSQGVFYAFHYYSPPSKSESEAVDMAVAQGIALGGIPTLLTETMSCNAIGLAKKSGIGAAHWHYSNYCDGSFGACITGWGGGNPNGCGHGSDIYGKEDAISILV